MDSQCGCSAVAGTRQAEHNAHQDHAYSRMAYSKLLAYTAANGTLSGGSATAAERSAWQERLDNLAPFPTQPSPYGKVFAEGNVEPPSPTSELRARRCRRRAVLAKQQTTSARPPASSALLVAGPRCLQMWVYVSA